MKVLHINTLDRGGAGNACIRLHRGLLDAGVSSSILFKKKVGQEPGSFEFKPIFKVPPLPVRIKNRGKRILAGLASSSARMKTESALMQPGVPQDVEYFSFPASGFDVMESTHYKEADVINLHWVAGFLDYASFFPRNKKPVVWTLHDMAPFSGGLHYSESYSGIEPNGRPGIREFSQAESALFDSIIREKKRSFASVNNLTIVALSDWLEAKSQNSELFSRFPHVKIPNGFDTRIFTLRDRSFARSVFGLSGDKKIVLFVSDSLKNVRKGFSYLLKALEDIDRTRLMLCTIGAAKPDLLRGDFVHLGQINDERLLSLAYAAADVFVIPSLEDNLPNVMIEALLCGTPVVGFPVGGIAETIVDGMNGYLCADVSAEALKDKIELFLKTSSNFDSVRIARMTEEKFNQNVQSAAYINLYESLIS